MRSNFLLVFSFAILISTTSFADVPDSIKELNSKVSVEQITLDNTYRTYDRFYRIIDEEKGVTCYAITSSSSLGLYYGSGVGAGAGAGSTIECIKD